MLQAFGFANCHAASQVGKFVGTMSPEQLLEIPRDQMVMVRSGQGAELCRRPNYLTDSEFAGNFTPDTILKPSSVGPAF